MVDKNTNAARLGAALGKFVGREGEENLLLLSYRF
jgi:hypothetical protein